MKRREFTTLATFAAAITLLPGGYAIAQKKKLRIGFSQATTIEPWRAQFNKDIIAEAAKHPEVQLIITDGEDKTEKQVADVENLIRQEVDALLISPKESAGLTGVPRRFRRLSPRRSRELSSRRCSRARPSMSSWKSLSRTRARAAPR